MCTLLACVRTLPRYGVRTTRGRRRERVASRLTLMHTFLDRYFQTTDVMMAQLLESQRERWICKLHRPAKAEGGTARSMLRSGLDHSTHSLTPLS